MLIVAPKAKTEATRRRIALLNKAGMCQGIERYHGRARGERQVIEGINGVRTIVSIAERHAGLIHILVNHEKTTAIGGEAYVVARDPHTHLG